MVPDDSDDDPVVDPSRSDGYLVIDSLRVPYSGWSTSQHPMSGHHDATAGRSLFRLSPTKDVTNSTGAASSQVTAPQPSSSSITPASSKEDHAVSAVRSFENTTFVLDSCDTCHQLDRYCDCRRPVCCTCDEAGTKCTWQQGRDFSASQPRVANNLPICHGEWAPRHADEHSQPFTNLGETSFDHDFSTLDGDDVLENFDFDAFLNGQQDQSFSFGDSGGELERDYWRNTVGVAEPMADVERPRPRPKGRIVRFRCMSPPP
jgi:hypothetical protein